MTDIQSESLVKPTLLAAEPQLFVTDIEASYEFYTKKLGFAVAFTYGNPPFYGQVCRDGARLNLRSLDKSPFDATQRDKNQLLSASVTLDDAKPLFLEYQVALLLAAILFARHPEWLPEAVRTLMAR